MTSEALVRSTLEMLDLGRAVKRVLSSAVANSPPITFRSLIVAAEVGSAPLATPSTVDTPVTVTEEVATLTTDTKVGSCERFPVKDRTLPALI